MDKGSIFHLSVEREDRMSMGPSLNTAAEGIIKPRCEEKGKGNRKRTTSSSALMAVPLPQPAHNINGWLSTDRT
jgi:hypothetical protein